MAGSEILDRLLGEVFGQGCRWEWGFTSGELASHYYVIFGKEGYPRWLLPLNPSIGLPALRGWRPYSRLSLMKWKLLLLAYRFGWLKVCGAIERVTVFSEMRDYQRILATSGQVVFSSVYIGNPKTTTQKAIVTLSVVGPKETGENGSRICGILKVPLGKFAARQLLHEADILTRISEEKPGIAPMNLVTDPCFIQTYLDVFPVKACLTDTHIQWLLSLSRQLSKTSLQEESARLKERYSAIAAVPERGFIEAVLDAISDRTELDSVLVHGDFAPWNIKKLPDNRLVLVDWESATVAGLPLLDLIHHECIQVYLDGKPVDIFDELLKNRFIRQYMEHFSLSVDIARKIFAYYWLETYCTALEEENKAKADGIWAAAEPLLKACLE